MNTNDVFHSAYDLDLDIPPDLDLNDVPMLSRMASTTTTKELTFPWNMNLEMLAAADHFTLLQTVANQLFADNADTIESIGTSIKPHLRGPMTPILIIVASIMVSVVVSFIVSIIQMAVLGAAVVYFFPSVLAAIPSATAPTIAGKPGAKPASRAPMAAFAGVLAASYAFSSLATIVVLASSAYAVLNQAAVASAKKNTLIKPEPRPARRDEPGERRRSSSNSMFRRLSRRRDSFDY
ncbi:hypothetical protein SCUCBS95973_004790 [Sporothrix curviconia]|uniref:Uncharacterized protein n=1 Tax=Sporothrix curviconia TaxID=1260050 RepID=A0ABP0BRJ7_9PEZI